MGDIRGIADLKPDPRNANTGTQRGRYMLDYSLRELGAGRSILCDADGNVIAGNKTLEVAAELGLDVEVVRTHGDRLVVVVREDLQLDGDDGRARQLAYADNRTSEVGLEWDVGQLIEDIDAGLDLDGLWRGDELEELVGAALAVPDFQPVDGDEQPRLDQKKPITCPHCGMEFVP
jgi:hypothetical protein